MGSAVRVSLRIDLWSEGPVVGRVQSFLDVRVRCESDASRNCVRSTMRYESGASHTFDGAGGRCPPLPPQLHHFLCLLALAKTKGGTDPLLQKTIERASPLPPLHHYFLRLLALAIRFCRVLRWRGYVNRQIPFLPGHDQNLFCCTSMNSC